MATTRLMREALVPLYVAAKNTHPGLLLQRGYAKHSGGDAVNTKTSYIQQACRNKPGDYYTRAYWRWRKFTDGAARFRSVTLTVESRMFIGLTGGGMLETGCVISHSYGAPLIPGSSIKGIVRACARTRLGCAGKAACDELFGTEATDERPSGLSGLIAFHDAWWVPGSTEYPLVQEVVTAHHSEYYGEEGKLPATDFDSPVPNAQVAVQGSFCFLIEGPESWLDIAERMLIYALSTEGAGAKTRAGYGLFDSQPIVDEASRCTWVDNKIEALMQEHRSQRDNILRGRPLAQAWSEIEDANLKQQAFDDIRARWQEKGWWEDPPPGRSVRQAKAIYDGHIES